MTPLQARVCRFIADRPNGTATDGEVYAHFETTRHLPQATVHSAVLALANAGEIVMAEAGTRLHIPHAFIDGKPVIGRML